MKHLIVTLVDISLSDARSQLAEAHDFLVDRCLETFVIIPRAGPLWGVQTKRMQVGLKAALRPAAVCKNAERFGEVVNMVATLERLVAALDLFDRHQESGGLRVKECHPSTSSAKGSNDLMLEDASGAVVVRCEVSDVVSGSADSNGKESQDIASLGCADGVPSDGIRRFLCTSPEFAQYLQRGRRKWAQRRYRYREFAVDDTTRTALVELISAPDPRKTQAVQQTAGTSRTKPGR